jgi:hypothetical protein
LIERARYRSSAAYCGGFPASEQNCRMTVSNLMAGGSASRVRPEDHTVSERNSSDIPLPASAK